MVLTRIASAADPNLVGWWKLDETSGLIAADSSGFCNNGTLMNMTGDEWINKGTRGGALKFCGAYTYIDCGNGDSLQVTGDFTIAAWVKLPRCTKGAYQGIAGKLTRRGGNASYMGYALVRDSLNFFRLLVSNGSTDDITGGAGSDEAYTDVSWHHLAGVRKDKTNYLYVDGIKQSEITANDFVASTDYFHIGRQCSNVAPPGDPRFFRGFIDDVRLYNKALTPAEIEELAVHFKAYHPFPEDGAVLTNFPGGGLGTSLQWKAGDFAVSQNVYFGTDYAEVEAGTGGTFCGNQTAIYFLVGYGYTPNDPCPTGLTIGTTYYWRIDEVNDLHPNSPWKGDVWSFSIPPTEAYNPFPANGAEFVDPNVDLSWKEGILVRKQTVYFGDDYDTVSNATQGGTSVGHAAAYDPGPLEFEKVYYWRVDTNGVFGLVPGDVWSFTTAGTGGGVRADYYHHDGETPHNPAELAFGDLVLTRIDPQINFNWGKGSPDPSINANEFSCKWTGEVKTAFTEIYTFYTNTDDGVKLWVDGHLIIDNWTDHTLTEDSGRIYLIGGQTYPLEMWWYERDSNAVAELRWSSPHTPKQLIPQAALSPPVKASDLYPPDGALLTNFPGFPMITLLWEPGYFAVSHDVYFGTNYAEVEVGTGGTFRGNQTATYFLVGYGYTPNDPCPTGLVPGTTYYWRIDEVEADGITKYTGDVWSFSIPSTKAYSPFPSDGSKFIEPNVDLKWKPAMGAIVQTVYFGSDYDIVNNATTGGIEVGSSATYDPGTLELEKIYYWRVDTIGVYGRIRGDVWSFSTANFIVVDDFEDYKDVEPDRIFDTWIDGRGNSKNGSLVGCMQYPDFVHGGKRSMLFNYDNSAANYSQASADVSNLKAGQDWIKPGTKALTLWFHGCPDNAPEPMYVAIADKTGQPAVVYHDDQNAAQIDTWTEWNIDLRDFAGINLADVNSIAIGFGDRDNPQAGGSGKMYFDDIRLYRSRCIPEKVTLLQADLNGDCVVDFRDLEIMAGDWLESGPDFDVDLNVDGTVEFKDYAVLADEWLDKQLWPEW